MKLRSSFNKNLARVCLLLGLLGSSLATSSTAQADEPRILVVGDDDVPAKVEDSVSKSLDGLGVVGKSNDYVAAARAQRLSPTSEAALTRIAPRARARMVVALTLEHKKLLISFRDGGSGAVVGKQKFASHGSALSSGARHKLVSTAKKALTRIMRNPEPPPSPPPEKESRPLQREAPPLSSYKPAPAPPLDTSSPPPSAADEMPAPEEQEASAPASAAQPEAEAAAEPEAAPASGTITAAGVASEDDFHMFASLGTGVGQRSIHVPGRFGGSTLDSGLTFPALELRAGARAAVSEKLQFGAEAAYRTVFGLVAQNEVGRKDLNSQSLIVGVALGYLLGEKDGPVLRVFLGGAYRSLTPTNPAFANTTFYGAVLRPELVLPLLDRLTLRIAPELIVAFGADVKQGAAPIAGLAAVGFGLGGEAALDVWIIGPLSAGIEFRESHMLVGSSVGTPLDDLERLILARALIQI
jgi:hypothetical protein